MDDLLLFAPSKRAHMVKLEDLLKHYLRTDLKYLQRSDSFLKLNYNTWGTSYV